MLENDRPSGQETVPILIDTLPVEPSSGGQRVYLLNLLEHLDKDTMLTGLLVCSRSNECEFRHFGHLRRIVLPWRTSHPLARVLTQQLVLPWLAFRHRARVLFEPRDVGPLLVPVPLVTAVLSGHLNYHFGITPLGIFRGIYQRLFIRSTMLRSARVIAISEYVANSVASFFRIPRERIVVTHLGGGIGERAGALDRRAPSGDRVVLFVSSLFRHKNAERLLEAYARVPNAPPLVLAGKDVGGEMARLQRRSQDLGISGRVSFRGRVTDEELLSLYRRAALLVYPSAVEGFGIPLAEAMWLGVPIVTSNRTSVPEVVGDAALMVNPDDIGALSEAIRRVLDDGVLAETLRHRGFARAPAFRWECTAERTAAVLRAVAGA